METPGAMAASQFLDQFYGANMAAVQLAAVNTAYPINYAATTNANALTRIDSVTPKVADMKPDLSSLSQDAIAKLNYNAANWMMHHQQQQQQSLWPQQTAAPEMPYSQSASYQFQCSGGGYPSNGALNGFAGMDCKNLLQGSPAALSTATQPNETNFPFSFPFPFNPSTAPTNGAHLVDPQPLINWKNQSYVSAVASSASSAQQGQPTQQVSGRQHNSSHRSEDVKSAGQFNGHASRLGRIDKCTKAPVLHSRMPVSRCPPPYRTGPGTNSRVAKLY